MVSLVDKIVSLEKEADSIVDEAHTRSKSILKSADEEFALYRDRMTADIEARLARFKAETEKHFEESLAAASQKHAERLRALNGLGEEFTVLQVNKILDRFHNW